MTVTTYPELEQGSDEWLAARCGILTASTIGRLLTIGTLGGLDYDCPECGAMSGEPCRSMAKRKEGAEPAAIKVLHPARVAWADQHAAQSPPVIELAKGKDADSLTLGLVAERITQHVESSFISDAMWRGITEEPLARAAYAEHHAPVTEMGFIVREVNGCRVGYSPDGLVGEDGAIEIKSRSQKAQVATILSGKIPAENLAQLHCGLWVTRRKWIDYVSYSNGMPLWVKRVEPEPMWMSAISFAVGTFEDRAAEMVAKYQAATVGLPVMERTAEIEEMRV